MLVSTSVVRKLRGEFAASAAALAATIAQGAGVVGARGAARTPSPIKGYEQSWNLKIEHALVQICNCPFRLPRWKVIAMGYHCSMKKLPNSLLSALSKPYIEAKLMKLAVLLPDFNSSRGAYGMVQRQIVLLYAFSPARHALYFACI